MQGSKHKALGIRSGTNAKNRGRTLTPRLFKVRPRFFAFVPGFTLIELLVVLGIVVLISLLILISASRFNSAILLRSLAYEVGLSIREAQLYGVAVKGSSQPAPCKVGPARQFCASYGVDFSKTSSTQFIVFADINDTGVYDGGPLKGGKDPTVETFNAQYGFTISNFCVGNGSKMQCSTGCPQVPIPSLGSCPSGQGNKLQSLDITFKRPNPDARINVVSSAQDVQPPYVGAIVVLSSPGGCSRIVSISPTGQIIVTGNPTC